MSDPRLTKKVAVRDSPPPHGGWSATCWPFCQLGEMLTDMAVAIQIRGAGARDQLLGALALGSYFRARVAPQARLP